MCYQKLLHSLGLFCSSTLTILSVLLAQLSYLDTIGSYWQNTNFWIDTLSATIGDWGVKTTVIVLYIPLCSANELSSAQNLTLSTNLFYCRMPDLESQEWLQVRLRTWTNMHTCTAMFLDCLRRGRPSRALTSVMGLVEKEPVSVSWLLDWEQGQLWWQRYATEFITWTIQPYTYVLLQ